MRESSPATRSTSPGSTPSLPFAYDDAGNMTERERSSSLKSVYTHDAWNRLVKVQNQPLPSGSPTTLSEYEYNGLHWRTVKRHDTSTPADGLDEQTRLYYDASWRLVEERVDENYVGSAGVNRHMQNLWGARYIDDLVARRRDANLDGDYVDSGEATFYAITDVQFSVVAMLNSSGALHERVAYDSYGNARHHWMDDVDGDGDVDTNDTIAVAAGIGKSIYQSGFNPSLDIDRSGTIDSTDKGMVSASTIAALPAGEISDRSATGPDNVLGYDGYVFNAESLLYTVRFRHYDTGLGRWLERDPAGYVDGMNRMQFAAGAATRYLDPFGLQPLLPEEVDGVHADCTALRNRIAYLEAYAQLRFLAGLSPHEINQIALRGATLNSISGGASILNIVTACKEANAEKAILEAMNAHTRPHHRKWAANRAARGTNYGCRKAASALADIGGNILSVVGFVWDVKATVDAWEQDDRYGFYSSGSCAAAGGYVGLVAAFSMVRPIMIGPLGLVVAGASVLATIIDINTANEMARAKEEGLGDEYRFFVENYLDKAIDEYRRSGCCTDCDIPDLHGSIPYYE